MEKFLIISIVVLSTIHVLSHLAIEPLRKIIIRRAFKEMREKKFKLYCEIENFGPKSPKRIVYLAFWKEGEIHIFQIRSRFFDKLAGYPKTETLEDYTKEGFKRLLWDTEKSSISEWKPIPN